ncbi:MAG: hypothetical protein AAGD07_24715 [Planctomycetota bacterium]
MPTRWQLDETTEEDASEPPLVMGVIDATQNVLEMKPPRYLEWLDSRVREMPLD